MSYIQVKDFGGKDRGLKFNMAAIDIFWGKINLSGEIEFTASTIYSTFYAGLMGNCMAKGEQADFTMEQVSEWVDELYEQGRKDEIVAVCNCMSEASQYKQRLVEINEKLKAQEEKKEIKKKRK